MIRGIENLLGHSSGQTDDLTGGMFLEFLFAALKVT